MKRIVSLTNVAGNKAPRTSMVMTLAALVVTAIMVSVGQRAMANYAATLAFILLVISVLLASIQHVKEERILDGKPSSIGVKPRVMLTAIGAYLRLRPIGLGNFLRLYLAYFIAILVRLISPDRFTVVGAYIPGKTLVRVRLGNLVAFARPGHGDIGLLALTQEPKVASWFLFQKEDVFVDVGAHIGSYTLRAAQSCRLVISVEPDIEVFTLLRQNVTSNNLSNVHLENVALSDHDGEGVLYPPNGWHTGTSSLSSKHSRGEPGNIVWLKRLDTLAENLRLSRIDWLKIDVEGHEVEVLDGASSALDRTRFVVVEVEHGHEDKCKEILTKKGFLLVARDPQEAVEYWLWEKGKGSRCE